MNRIARIRQVSAMRKAARTLRGATLDEHYTAKLTASLIVPTEKMKIIASLDQIQTSLSVLRERSRHPSQIVGIQAALEGLRDQVLGI